MKEIVLGLSLGLLAALFLGNVKAHAHDPEHHDQDEWYRSLMRPDMPTSPCCGEADAYWADEVHVRNGKTFATITDDRDDGPLGRPHIPNGTEIEIPDSKLKWQDGNPTGHAILFLSVSRYPYCFVQGTGG